MYLEEAGYGHVEWIDLARDTVQLRAVVYTVKELSSFIKDGVTDQLSDC
jgi:hypothetical protein